MRSRAQRRDLVLGISAFALTWAVVELAQSSALVDFLIRVAAIGIFATSLNLLIGYTGMVSFGHGMFFGAGAYAFGLLMQKAGTSVPVGFALTLVIAAALATVVGAICVRLKEIYFAFLSLALQMFFHSVILSLGPLTGGDQGLTGGIPRPVFLGVNLADQKHLCLAAVALLVALLLVMHHLTRSPLGYAMRMIRDNATRAAFLGVAVWRLRLLVFVLAGTIAAAGGVVMSLFVSAAYPEFAYWTMSGEAIFAIMMGGAHLFLGPLLGTVALLLLNDLVTIYTRNYGLALGTVILLFALGFRRGLADFLLQAWTRARRRGAPLRPEEEVADGHVRAE